MALTLNQFLFLVITLAVVVAIVFLITLLIQLRRTAAEAEKALAEFREAARNLNALQATVQQRLDDVGRIVDTAKKAAQTVSQTAQMFGSRISKPAARLWPLIVPVVGFLVRRWKSRKEEKDVGE